MKVQSIALSLSLGFAGASVMLLTAPPFPSRGQSNCSDCGNNGSDITIVDPPDFPDEEQKPTPSPSPSPTPTPSPTPSPTPEEPQPIPPPAFPEEPQPIPPPVFPEETQQETPQETPQPKPTPTQIPPEAPSMEPGTSPTPKGDENQNPGGGGTGNQGNDTSNPSSNIPASVQQQLALLLTGDPTNKSLFEDSRLNPLLSALAKGGSEETIVLQLAKSLLGLFRGDKVDPKRLLAAVAAYNAFIKASRAEFLKTPPPELIAIRQILSQLVEAARAADIQPGEN